MTPGWVPNERDWKLKTSQVFYVWNPKRSLPSKEHNTLEDAVREAERLSGHQNTGDEFFVVTIDRLARVTAKPHVEFLKK